MKTKIEDSFRDQHGEKYRPESFSVAFGFKGSVSWDGHQSIALSGDFGENLNQIGYWRNNIPVEINQTLGFYLEYEKDSAIELAMEITVFEYGKVSNIMEVYSFDGTDLESEVLFTNAGTKGIVFVSLKAKGNGALKIRALHVRFSVNGTDYFLPGGSRIVTKNREEIFYYFNPGNLKPPLNIYFSGYKTRESFEGYDMMKKLEGPFLLISDPRLEGGAFYIGDDEYEKNIINIIKATMNVLRIENGDVVMSGIGMGAFGALYYGAFIIPHTILVGKPLVNLGDVAVNEHLNRPGVFPTSLDVAKKLVEEKNTSDVYGLNRVFWDVFDKADFSNTSFAISYMIEDDYDRNAYHNLQEHLHDAGVIIYGKGIHGRHRDASGEILKWFLDQYEEIRNIDS